MAAKVVKDTSTGLKSSKRQFGSFLLLPPIGAGKTGGLAEVLFRSDKSLIHFDMSEFMEKQLISKPIARLPATYVMRRPDYRVREAAAVLHHPVGQIEKVYADIYNILLRVFKDG